MVSLELIQAEAKRNLTNDVLEAMENYLSNSQLMELNKSLNTNLENLQVYKHNVGNTDYETRNRDLVDKFLNNKKLKGLSQNSLENYSMELEKFLEYSAKLVLDYTPDDIRDYLIFRQQLCGCSNVSLNNYRRVLSSFYKFLEVEEYIIRNPLKAVGALKEPKRIKKPFTDEDIEKMRKVLNNDYDYRDIALFELLLSSGVRASECASLNIDDIDWVNRSFHVIGKGNKERVCYFGTKAKLALEEYLSMRVDDNPALFVTINEPYERFGTSGMGTLFRELGRYAGVNNVHMHRFRRTMSSKLSKRGVPLDQIQKILGHDNINTTLIYVSIDDSEVKLNYNKHVK